MPIWIGKLICFVTGHIPEIRIRVGPTGDLMKYYQCRLCEKEVTEDDWKEKWHV